MPRAMEIEACSYDELWRTAQPGETYLDPPPPISKKELKKEKRAALRQKRMEKELRKEKSWLRRKLEKDNDNSEDKDIDLDTASSTYTSDSEYDEAYEKALREEYVNPSQFSRDRDFARKYALNTSELIRRYLTNVKTGELLENSSLIPSLLTRLYLDDCWQLVTELRLNIDQIDGDMGAELHLRLLESIGTTIRQNVAWARSTVQEIGEWIKHLDSVSSILATPPELTAEVQELSTELQILSSRIEQTLNLLVASTGLSQSTLVIDQTSGINKLTELAFFFIPLSFITSIFSMQVYELTQSPPRLWTWGLSLAIVFITTYLIRSTVRSPSIRMLAMAARVTMLNRFTSSSSRSRRFNTIGNRAIIKFFFFLITATICLCIVVAFYLLAWLLMFGGLWLGGAATAIYFIVTRWPDLVVVIPCFICLPLSALGMWASYYWNEEIGNLITDWSERTMNGIKDMYPAHWTLDRVDDDDLAREGVETYARQAVVLSST